MGLLFRALGAICWEVVRIIKTEQCVVFGGHYKKSGMHADEPSAASAPPPARVKGCSGNPFFLFLNFDGMEGGDFVFRDLGCSRKKDCRVRPDPSEMKFEF